MRKFIGNNTEVKNDSEYGPELDKRVHHLNKTNDFWRVDETYIKVKEKWMH